MNRKLLALMLLAGPVFAADEPDRNRFLNSDVFELEICGSSTFASRTTS